MGSTAQDQHSILLPGVLGGLGPAATVDFLTRVIEATDAATDQDHLPLLVDHNPRVPNRHAAIAGHGPSAAPALIAMARRLERAGADFLVMPCNTAHAFAPDISAAITIPLINMIELVASTVPGGSRVGVMAAEGCLQSQLYQRALARYGCSALTWNSSELDHFMALVYRIKAGDRAESIRHDLRDLAESLLSAGAEVLIAGCTEIPLFLSQERDQLPLLSSTDLLVSQTIALARGLLPLESRT
ncbi:MAG: amino acid racemase [Pseudomonadota bacterium]